MADFLVFDTESQIDAALLLLFDQKDKCQRVDGKWVTPQPENYGQISSTLPPHSIEQELMQWYLEDTKEYDILKEMTWENLNANYEKIDSIMEEVKRDFTNENIVMGISQMGQTQNVLDALEKVDYCMRSRSVDALPALIDEVPRSSPFLTEERLTNFKNIIFQRLSEEGIL